MAADFTQCERPLGPSICAGVFFFESRRFTETGRPPPTIHTAGEHTTKAPSQPMTSRASFCITKANYPLPVHGCCKGGFQMAADTLPNSRTPSRHAAVPVWENLAGHSLYHSATPCGHIPYSPAYKCCKGNECGCQPFYKVCQDFDTASRPAVPPLAARQVPHKRKCPTVQKTAAPPNTNSKPQRKPHDPRLCGFSVKSKNRCGAPVILACRYR